MTTSRARCSVLYLAIGVLALCPGCTSFLLMPDEVAKLRTDLTTHMQEIEIWPPN